MKKLTNKGIGKVELMVCLCAILVLLAIAIVSLVNNNEQSNLKMFKKLGDNFAYKVSIYKDRYPRIDNRYYLDYLIDDGIDIELNNPTNTGENCSRYESYVEISDNGKKSVVLKCGNYLVEGMYEDKYAVYEVSEWSDDTSNIGESQILYNYKKEGKEVASKYMLENEFIDFYNQNENSSISGVYDVSSVDVELLSKELYREKNLIKEID